MVKTEIRNTNNIPIIIILRFVLILLVIIYLLYFEFTQSMPSIAPNYSLEEKLIILLTAV